MLDAAIFPSFKRMLNVGYYGLWSSLLHMKRKGKYDEQYLAQVRFCLSKNLRLETKNCSAAKYSLLTPKPNKKPTTKTHHQLL